MTSENKVLDPLVGHWRVQLMRGVLAILVGIVTFFLPGKIITIALPIMFAFYAMADGVFNINNAVQSREQERWWTPLVMGGVEILLGLILFRFSEGVGLFIAAWAIITGAFTLFGALLLRQEVEDEYWLVAAGILSIVFGLLALVLLMIGPNVLRFVLGIYLIALGAILARFGIWLRGL